MTTPITRTASILSRGFILATVERALGAGAAAVLSVWAVGDGALNAIEVDWRTAAGIYAGGALVAVLKALTAATIDPSTGPSLFGVEVPKSDVAARDTGDDTIAGPAAPPDIDEGDPVDVVPEEDV